MQTASPRFKYVDWGTAYVYKGIVHMNRALLNDPGIYDKVLAHELRHWAGEKYVDHKERWDWDIFFWKLRHPKTWIDLVPVWYHGGLSFSIDWNRVAFWSGVLIGLIGLLIIYRWFRWH